MLNPFELSRLSRISQGGPFIYVFNDQQIESYLPAVWADKTPPEEPVAIQPVYKSKRIVVQKGVFYAQMDLIKAELQMAGVTQSTLFPELSGLAQELKEYWR